VRVLVDSDVLVTSPTFVAADGESPTDAASTPTVTAAREDGTALVAPAVSDVTGTGVYGATLLGASHTSALDVLSLVWSGSVTGAGAQVYAQTVEVVGGFYVSLPDLRSMPELSNTTKHATASLRAARTEFEFLAERYCEVAFVPRYARDLLRGDGSNRITLGHHRPHSLRSIEIDGEAQTTSEFHFDGLVLEWDSGSFPVAVGEPNVEVVYEHGHEFAPAMISQACRVYVEQRLLGDRSGIPRLALSVDSEFGNMRLSTPGPNRPTGIPLVDAVLNEYSERVPGVA
jgi:hypothetical protein